MASTRTVPRIPSLVVGVDFGTTFTGFSYALIPSTSRSDFLNMDSLAHLNPEPKVMYFQNTEQIKIPTQLCYCSKNSPTIGASGGNIAPYTWGSRAKDCSMTPYKYFKLQLGPESMNLAPKLRLTGTCVDNDRKQVRTNLANASGLLVDFLSAARQEFMDRIVEEYSNEFTEDEFRIHWVFTIPGFFEPKLLTDLLEEHLPRAGFVEPTSLGISFVLEPEAAAIRVLSQSLLSANMTDTELNAGDRILVCDGGGGTTDLFALQIVTIKVDRSVPRIEMKPLSESKAADTIGAIDINRAFQKYLEDVFEAALRQAPMLTMRSGFQHDMESDKKNAYLMFETYKLQFTGSYSDPMVMPIPLASLGELTVRNIDLDEGILRLGNDHMKKFFSKVIPRMIRLLERQLVALDHENPVRTVSKIFLVGGLGASPYIQSVLQDWAATRTRPVEIVLPSNPREAVSAVMCGAVQHGMQQVMLKRPTKTHIIPSKSYGFILDEPYDASRHPDCDMYIDSLTGERMVKNQIRWVVKKGIPIEMHETMIGEAIAQTTTSIHLGKKPGKQYLRGEYRHGYLVVMNKFLEPDELPTNYAPHDNTIEALFSMDMNAGPYDNLQHNFKKNSSSKRTFDMFSRKKKKARYWVGQIELNLHFSAGESLYGSTKIQGAGPDNVEIENREKWFRRKLHWFKG